MEHSAGCVFRGSQVVKYPVNPVGNLFPGESCSFHLAARPVGLRPRRVFSSCGCVSDRVRPASSNTNLPPLTSRVKHWSKLWESQPTGSSLTLPPSSNHDQHCWPTSGSLHHRHTDSAMPSHGDHDPCHPHPIPTRWATNTTAIRTPWFTRPARPLVQPSLPLILLLPHPPNVHTGEETQSGRSRLHSRVGRLGTVAHVYP